MLDLYRELQRLAEALDTDGIAYALVGGLAVSIYTTPRATEDIDVMVAPEDVGRLVAAVERLGFRPAGAPMRLAGGRLQIQRLTKFEGSDLLPLDVLFTADPELRMTLDERREILWEGRRLWIVNVDGLRVLKRLRGSTRDRADLEALGGES